MHAVCIVWRRACFAWLLTEMNPHRGIHVVVLLCIRILACTRFEIVPVSRHCWVLYSICELLTSGIHVVVQRTRTRRMAYVATMIRVRHSVPSRMSVRESPQSFRADSWWEWRTGKVICTKKRVAASFVSSSWFRDFETKNLLLSCLSKTTNKWKFYVIISIIVISLNPSIFRLRHLCIYTS